MTALEVGWLRVVSLPGVTSSRGVLCFLVMSPLRSFGWLLMMLFAMMACAPLEARVTRVEIASRTDVLQGKVFGDSGSYERITGRVYFSLPVANPHNVRIVYLANAVHLKDGVAEVSADLLAIRPKDARKGNGSLRLEGPSRGRSRIIALVDGGDWDVAND